jgi:hypothetical protein
MGAYHPNCLRPLAGTGTEGKEASLKILFIVLKGALLSTIKLIPPWIYGTNTI